MLGSCLRALTGLEGTERAAVLTQQPGQEPVLRSLHGPLEPADLVNRELPAGFALHVAGSDNKTVHSLDVTQDISFAMCSRRSEGRSLLVVPMPNGILYADNPSRAGAFPHADVRKLETFASEIAPQLQAALALPRPQAPAPEHHVTALRLGAALLVLALGWWGAGVVFHASHPPPPPPPPPTVAQAEPQVVAASFLSMIRFKQLGPAYALLSTHQQKRISQEQFVKEATLWLKDPKNAWEMDYRRAGPATVVGRRAEIVIQPAPGTKAWNYRFVQETDGGAWKLDHWDAGPMKAL